MKQVATCAFLGELHFLAWELDRDREGPGECNELEDGEGDVGTSDCASCTRWQSLASDDRLSEFAKVRMDHFRNSYSFITYANQGLLVFLPPYRSFSGIILFPLRAFF